jgi:hypothetical protein
MTITNRSLRVGLLILSLLSLSNAAQKQGTHHGESVAVPLQPFALAARQYDLALEYLGQPLAPKDRARLTQALSNKDEKAAVAELQAILDQYTLAIVDINPESRVKVEQGPAKAELVEGGTRIFLVKVINQAGVTAPLEVDSPNQGLVYQRSTGSAEPQMRITPADARDRWAQFSIYRKQPMRPRLSGLGLEYQILEVYSRDQGKRSAKIGFNVGQGTQDIGFRNEVEVLFDALPARQVKLRLKDENGQPVTGSLVIRDHLGRVYPSPAKRLAPDFPFQSQIYRADGDVLKLPEGSYTLVYSRGPEYVPQTKNFTVDGKGTVELNLDLKRWIDPSKNGWYSGDHHIHAAGCAHYENPTQGVRPEDMWSQVLGEGLNVGCVLTWGPCYYHQKQFFTSQDHPLSKPNQILHYDLEVSGFPSSHTGHLVLIGLKEQDYPGTKRIEDWPTWDLPILKWAKAQGAVAGFAHSGWGLQVPGNTLPTYALPPFDGIGANEYIVDVTHDAVDFISTVDTPPIWELNIWYHTLNVGFRTRISGETDFPCIYQERVGLGRSYCKIDGQLAYRSWVDAVRDGRSYVSDGRSHLIDFKVNGQEVGVGGSEIRLAEPGSVKVEAKVAAYLDLEPNQEIRKASLEEKPYWDVERARIGTTREVPVELIVNGQPVARKNLLADGQLRTMEFDVPIRQSSWVALRILPSSHTNPVFALVGGKPIRASQRSAEWCLAAVNQCWTQKAPRIAANQLEEARKAYDHARQVYARLIKESSDK